MMYNDAIDQALATAKNTKIEVVKLGEVTSISGGRPRIKHFGETSSSSKDYACIDGYIPEVGDTVAMLQQANTYIILGKVINAAPTVKYLTKDAADELYLALEYMNKLEDSAHNTLTLAAAVLKPQSNNNIELGASALMFKNGFFKKLTVDGTELDATKISYRLNSSTTYSLAIVYSSNQAAVEPSANNTINLGSSSKKFKNSYLGGFYGEWEAGVNNYNIQWDSNHLVPSSNKVIDLGTSNRQYRNIYGETLYANGTAVTSDRKLKDDIEPLDDKHVEFFKNLKPVSFKYKDGTSGRKHTGFIAQEVEEAIEEAGMTGQDIAAVVKTEDDTRYLRYEELIAIHTKVIQNLMAKVESLEAKVNKLENERRRT